MNRIRPSVRAIAAAVALIAAGSGTAHATYSGENGRVFYQQGSWIDGSWTI